MRRRGTRGLLGPSLVWVLTACAAPPTGPNAQLTQVACQVNPKQGEAAKVSLGMAVGGKAEIADATLRINYGDGSEQTVPHVHPAALAPDVGTHVYTTPGHYRVEVSLTGADLTPQKKSCELDVIPAPPAPPKA